jgi:2-polyprenyl-3-methyl-5-hydroxy-6-metoxy-1,4-benzoquinol methylase
MNINSSIYIGEELEIFKSVTNWKNYWNQFIKPYLKGSVLEVGAGMGSNTTLFLESCPAVEKITALEPDATLASKIPEIVGQNIAKVRVRNGYLNDMSNTEKFDVILYIDVLEHIESDIDEITLAKSLLKEKGILIILVPAHNFLFNPFDKAIGHYRRYNRKNLQNAVGTDIVKKKLIYLDSVGLLLPLANKLFLKQRYPTKRQVLIWDKLIIPCSKILDRLLFHTEGKSLLGIWEKSK